MLRMKTECRRCKTKLARKEVAYICSLECTYCKRCSEELHYICEHCQGTLVLRPTRLIQPVQISTPELKKCSV
ncbi:DUF1272 domain-containing protein [Shewanella sp. MBTL60-007]|uniref:DUF1272 domain-containing protein n=1 Tax=Shewanella sp. MBTL60-007 TaxID=2815911 RepID=UPI001BBBCDAA|nr:DUF1272 domain-containing protein [Shewanella sp. MBTL60-007]GIU13939.1 hypothetical protein TUM3792_04180 [Shewanella sp. MBTL60-007]